MVAVRNYNTEDRSQLSFHKGDIIRLQHMDGLEAGETQAESTTEEFHSNISAFCPCGLFKVPVFLVCVSQVNITAAL